MWGATPYVKIAFASRLDLPSVGAAHYYNPCSGIGCAVRARGTYQGVDGPRGSTVNVASASTVGHLHQPAARHAPGVRRARGRGSCRFRPRNGRIRRCRAPAGGRSAPNVSCLEYGVARGSRAVPPTCPAWPSVIADFAARPPRSLGLPLRDTSGRTRYRTGPVEGMPCSIPRGHRCALAHKPDGVHPRCSDRACVAHARRRSANTDRLVLSRWFGGMLAHARSNVACNKATVSASKYCGVGGKMAAGLPGSQKSR
jgi:hypothetical protein